MKNAELLTGAELTLVPEKPVAGGSMLARHDGRVVLVRGAIPGERVRARVERVTRDVAHAVTIDVLEPQADRRAPPVDPACGGNAFAHIAYARQLTLKAEIVADALARLARLRLERPVPVTPSPELGYRMRARFHASGGRAGFHREGTHELCDPETSGQLQPAAVACLHAIVRRLTEEGGHPREVAGIELSENIDGSERAAHVEFRGHPPGEPLARMTGIGGLTGLSWSAASDPRTHVVAGSPYVVDAAPAPLRRHVRSFFQANRYLVSDLAGRVVTLVPEGRPTLDLYAGVGLFATALASTRDDVVIAVEGDATSALDLEANAACCARRFTTHHRSVEDYLGGSQDLRHLTVVLDPPRTGLSRDVARALVRHSPARMVYVSCDVATFARDVRIFVQAGYGLAHLEAFDLFPNTAHVETVAVLEREKESGVVLPQ